MTARENKALVRHFIHLALTEKDPVAAAAFLAPEFTHNGFTCTREQWVAIAMKRCDYFGDLRVVIEDLIGEGDRVVSRLTIQAVHVGDWPVAGYGVVKRTGQSLVRRYIDIYRLVDGLIAEIWEQTNILEVLQQLGEVIRPPEAR
ncbi:MAG: ester cyclase [Chloroflexi bacterium]|nr:ester cyclase [Chloroflexota bacterium]